MEKFEKKNITYYPVPYLIGTFMLTWCCAVLMFRIDYSTHTIHFTVLDFLGKCLTAFMRTHIAEKLLEKREIFQTILLRKKSQHVFIYCCISFVCCSVF